MEQDQLNSNFYVVSDTAYIKVEVDTNGMYFP